MMLLLAEYADRMPIVGIQKHFAAVIPAQAGIQTSVFQEYSKISVISSFWIPACAGMTAVKVSCLSLNHYKSSPEKNNLIFLLTYLLIMLVGVAVIKLL